MSRNRPKSRKSFADVSRDGFSNVLAKLGIGENNQISSGRYRNSGGNITKRPDELDAAYRENWLVGKTIDAIAEDMTREGVEITCAWEADKTPVLEKEMERLGIWGALSDGIKWGRLYGGALAVMLIDGHDLSQPLKVENIGRGAFRGIRIYSRHEVTPSQPLIKELGPNLGLPEYYTINVAREGMNNKRVHHTRCIRFIGTKLPYREAQKEQGWGASVIERTFDRIVALDSATMGAAQLVFKAHLRTVKVKDLRKILAEGGKREQALVKMFEYVRLMQSIEGLSLFDSDDEFQTQSYTFAGLKDILLAIEEQMAGATGIPLVRMLGQSPGGLSSTGESDFRTYYDGIAVQQDDDLRPPLTALFPVMSYSLFGMSLPADFSFAFPSLWKPTDMERADIAMKDAQTMDNLYASGLLKKSQAMRELKQSSHIHGRFATITDEGIKEAEETENSGPPSATAVMPTESAGGMGGQPEGMNPKAANTSSDEPTPQEISLNGAQVSSMVQIVAQVAAGTLPRESGVQMLLAAFPVSLQQAEKIMGEVGRGFVPAQHPEGANAPAF